ncbi:MAG: magnesium transporter [Bdellovibrionales bacterium]|nr:magnesium transporter [Bdellovibrionales bacterium]
MNEEQSKMLVATIHKLFSRNALQNIGKIFEKTHAADIAAVLDFFSIEEAKELFQLIESQEKKSEILAHLSEERQQGMLSDLKQDEVLELVSLLEVDDAADLLGALPEEEAQTILNSMVKEVSEEVADLMAYPEDSAGGIMSTDFLALNQDLTVAEATKIIQTEDDDLPITFYIYVVNDNNNLVGVMSLKQLLLSRPHDKLKDLMHPEVITVSLSTDQEEVAKIVEKYDFLSMPVTDGLNKLVGVITVDDVIDVIREEAEEDLMSLGQAGMEHDVAFKVHFIARLPWLLLSLLNGLVCYALIYFLGVGEQDSSATLAVWQFAGFLPILLGVGMTIGNQVTTIMSGAIRAGKVDVGLPLEYLKKELLLAFSFSVLFFLVVVLLWGALFSWDLGLYLSSALVIQVWLSFVLAVVVPIFLKKVDFDPTSASSPIFSIFSQALGVSTLFLLFQEYMTHIH